MENLAKLPVDSLRLEQWEKLVESIGEDKRIDKSVYELSGEEKTRLKKGKVEEKEQKDLIRRLKGESQTAEEKEQKDLIKKRRVSETFPLCFSKTCLNCRENENNTIQFNKRMFRIT